VTHQSTPGAFPPSQAHQTVVTPDDVLSGFRHNCWVSSTSERSSSSGSRGVSPANSGWGGSRSGVGAVVSERVSGSSVVFGKGGACFLGKTSTMAKVIWLSKRVTASSITKNAVRRTDKPCLSRQIQIGNKSQICWRSCCKQHTKKQQ